MKVTPKLVTYDDYVALPDDGQRYEIVNGELFVTPATSIRHQEIITKLLVLVGSYVSKHRLGVLLTAPTDVVLSMIDTVQPDVLFVSESRLKLVATNNVVAIPDLIIEVVSPSSAQRDRGEKWKLYQKYELPEHWVVDPDSKTIDFFSYFDNHLNLVETLGSGQQLRSCQIEGLVINVSEVFE